MVQVLSNDCQVFVKYFCLFFCALDFYALTKAEQSSHNWSMSPHYSIRAVVEETGLPAHTIRAWERRYGVPKPVRTKTNRRVYAEEDVLRLKALHRAVESGHSIGMIAALPTEDLQKLVVAALDQQSPSGGGDLFFRECQGALQDLNAESLEAQFRRASSVLGIDRFLSELILPLIAFVDVEWSQGRLSIAQEHLVSALVRTHLERLRLSIQSDRQAPRVVVATPANQHHEIGAMLAAIVAARADWNVTYLGPNLPALEIALAAKRTRASAIALSVVYPGGDSAVDAELKALGALLEPSVRLLVGGQAAESYASVLDAIGAKVCQDLDCLRDFLAGLRQSAMQRG